MWHNIHHCSLFLIAGYDEFGKGNCWQQPLATNGRWTVSSKLLIRKCLSCASWIFIITVNLFSGKDYFTGNTKELLPAYAFDIWNPKPRTLLDLFSTGYHLLVGVWGFFMSHWKLSKAVEMKATIPLYTITFQYHFCHILSGKSKLLRQSRFKMWGNPSYWKGMPKKFSRNLSHIVSDIS